MSFVNRDRELNAPEEWWARPSASMGIVWGRRRVGKTALLERFARTRRSVFHVATGRPPEQELLELSRAAARAAAGAGRDLAADPFLRGLRPRGRRQRGGRPGHHRRRHLRRPPAARAGAVSAARP